MGFVNNNKRCIEMMTAIQIRKIEFVPGNYLLHGWRYVVLDKWWVKALGGVEPRSSERQSQAPIRKLFETAESELTNRLLPIILARVDQ